MKSLETGPKPSEQPKKKWKVMVEMEGWGKDGTEYTGSELWEEIIVEAPDEDTASDTAIDMDFGNKRPSAIVKIKETTDNETFPSKKMEKEGSQIEMATIENLKDIQEMNKLLFEEEFAKYDETINTDWPLSQDGEDFYKERIESKNACAFILKINGEMIGYLVGSLSEDEFYRNIDKFAELDDMYIIEKYRSAGHGKKLYNIFIDWCREHEVKRIKVLVTAKNKQAINFYKTRGFDDYNLTLEADID